MDNSVRFGCGLNDCNYSISDFNWLMNHCWDKQLLNLGFTYKFKVSKWANKFTNIESLRRHLKSKHLWFHEKYLQRYGRVKNENTYPDENSDNENVIPMQLDESSVNSGENNESDCESVVFRFWS